MKKFFWTAAMAIMGLADVALGVFALGEAGRWLTEDIGTTTERVKKFIHDKTADKAVVVEEKDEETDGE